MRQRTQIIVLALLTVAALALVAPALSENRKQKIDVYRAFIASYGEGNRINLSNEAHRFDAPFEDVIDCEPSVLFTTAVSRHFRTLKFVESDFPDSSIHVVDPDVQRAMVNAYDPGRNISSEADIDGAVRTAFDAGLLRVSDMGFDLSGRRALLTFSFTCGDLCGHSGTATLERRDDRWVVEQQPCGAVTMY